MKEKLTTSRMINIRLFILAVLAALTAFCCHYHRDYMASVITTFIGLSMLLLLWTKQKMENNSKREGSNGQG
nr:hypothetical protein [uncultured Pedobacter sp.]